jgi:hypothetical protein
MVNGEEGKGADLSRDFPFCEVQKLQLLSEA